MTIAGIITMLLSIGAAWALLICCIRRLLRNSSASAPARIKNKNTHS